MSHKIDWYDKDNPQLQINLKNGRRIDFSVACVQENAHSWLGSILERMFEEEIERAVNRAVDAHQQKLRNLLNIREPKN